MTLDQLQALVGSANIKITDIISLIEGQPVTIQVDPFNQSIAAIGKTLEIAFVANGVTIQLK